MKITDLVPGALYSIEESIQKSSPSWKGRATYIGLDTSGFYPEGTLEFRCEDGIGGAFRIEDVKERIEENYILEANLRSALEIAVDVLTKREKGFGYVLPSALRAGLQDNLNKMRAGQPLSIRS